MFKLGTNKISGMYLRSTEIAKAYLGSDLVYQKSGGGGISEYQDLEYLQGNANAYIDTGVALSSLVKPRIVTRFKMVSIGDYDWFGCAADGTKLVMIWNINSSSSLQYIRWLTSSAVAITSYQNRVYFNFSDGFHTLDVGGVGQGENLSVYVDGIDRNTLKTSVSSNEISSNHILIFKARNSAGTSQFASFQIYSEEQLIRDFIPRRRIADGELGMYDNITGQFITKSGSGNFIAGPDKTI